MLSFKSLAIAAAVAFGAISTAFAAPASDFAVVARDAAAPRSVVVILADVTAKVTPYCHELTYLTKANATVEVITPIVGNIKGVFASAIIEVNVLVGQPAAVILASVDGTVKVTVGELAVIVAELLHVVFGALGFVFGLVGFALTAVVAPLLCSVAEALGALLVCVLHVVDGLLIGLAVAVVALIGDIIPIILKLQATVVISIFGIPCGCN